MKRILIIRLSSLGDVILSTPILKLLKEKYSNGSIDYLVNKNYKDAVANNPNLSTIFEYEKEKNQQTLINSLKKKKYALIIDLQNNFRSRSIVSKLPGKVYRFSKPTLKKFLLVNFKWNRLKELRTIPQMYADSISEIEFNGELPELHIPEKKLPSVKPKNNFIGFAPGAKHFTKIWPVEYFVDLGKKLIDAGFTILLLGGKADKDICSKIHNQLKNSIDLSTNDDLLQIARDMKECKLVVCNDSGLMHAAQAVDVPLVTIFGSTVKEFGFFPYSENSLIIENEGLKCRPCSHIGKSKCPKKHFKCMLEITPELVFNKITGFIKNL
ncbi:MAG: glycosyltransferase family 9 protein [Melioribacteraceae bacterium]|nr:glycosyltransferase family 9 protein [Melioribacteraceae bacterium]